MNHIEVSINELAPFIIEQLSQGKEVEFTVSGNSMRPFYFHQQTIVTLSKLNRPYKIGDVIFFKDNLGRFILHRIGKIKEDIYTCGDAMRVNEIAPRKTIYGVVTKVHHFNKTIDVARFDYRCKVFIWMKLKFIRRYLLFIHRKFSRKNY